MEESQQLEELRSEKRFFDHMPRDILDFLCDHLSITNQLQFSRVCESSHCSVYKRPNPKSPEDHTPWLISLTETNSSFCKTIYDDQVTCYHIGSESFKHPDPKILGYFKGWLFVQYYHNDLTQLVNLFVNFQVDLPPLSSAMFKQKSRYFYAQAFALSLCKSMRPILIAIVSQYGDLALCKINGGSTWKAHDDNDDHQQGQRRYYVNITFYDEKLYAMRKKFHQIDIFQIEEEGGADDLRLVPLGVIDSSQVINVSISPLLRQAYLVEDSRGDNMFLVMEYQEKFGLLFQFEIFKVVINGDDDLLFVKVDTLADHQILLLSESCSEIIDVKDCPTTSSVFRGNQICFMGGLYHDVGIFSLKDETTIWALPDRGVQWIFPRLATTGCCCNSH